MPLHIARVAIALPVHVYMLLLLLWAAASAAEPVPAPPNPCAGVLDRPCVGLVLGGGGARGGAHLGVLRYLEEQHIPVDLIVGTSAGAFIGGLYASGKSVAEIEELFRETDWKLGYQDNLPRSQIPIRRQRQLDDFPIHVDLGLGREGVSIPPGILQGQGMKKLVANLLGAYPSFASFDDLPIPFRAVAADIETGAEVVLASGDLATVMQASMSIPGLVRPTQIEGRLLVDGAIANNLPVSVAKDLGADIVIAVDIGAPNLTRAELGSSVAIVRQLASFLTLGNVAHQKSLLTSRDVLLTPTVSDINFLDFDRLLDGEEPGYREAGEKLAGAGLPTDAAIVAAHTREAPGERFSIDEVALTNATRLGDDYILHRLGFRAGESYNLAELQEGAGRLYGQGSIARIDTELVSTPQGEVLDVKVLEKEWGPGYMDLKLAIEDDLDTVSRYQVGASYRLTNLSAYGAEWYTAGEFGTNKYLLTELYWPLRNSGFYLEGSGRGGREVFEFTADDSNLPDQRFIRDETVGLAGLGWGPFDQLDVLLAALYTDGEITLPAELSQFLGESYIDYSQVGALLRVNYDSLDDASFPRRGWKLVGNLRRMRDELFGESTWNRYADVEFNGVVSLGPSSLRTRLRYASVDDDDSAALIGLSSLGGFLNLSGNPKDSIIGQHVRFGSLVYTYELAANDFGAINLPLYIGVSGEAGNAWDERDAIDYDDLIYSGSLFLGWDSPLGPMYFAYGRSDSGQQSFYAFMGMLF